MHQTVHAQMKRNRTDQGNDHHRGKDADIGKARRILFHAVKHTRDGDKIAGLIIELLPALHPFQERNTARREQQIRSHDDQTYRQHKIKEDHAVQLRSDGTIVAKRQRRHTGQRVNRQKSRLFLALLTTAHQLDGTGFADLQKPHRKVHAKHPQKVDDRLPKRLRVKDKAHLHRQVAHPQQHKKQQLGKHHPKEHAARHRSRIKQDRLEEQHDADMLLFQSQNVVQTEFLLPPFYQEAVGIDQKEDQDQRKDPLSHIQHHPRITASRQHLDDIVVQDGSKYKIGKHRKDACNQIGKIHVPVSQDPLPRHYRQNLIRRCPVYRPSPYRRFFSAFHL